ncbi:p110 1L [African swine fever virus]|uniref:p110 1L n=1 Tax=African swine fever virus TaxID=10497 RepID=A0A856Z1G2_ASF|nr:p110 1L [African swine fever virus]
MHHILFLHQIIIPFILCTLGTFHIMGIILFIYFFVRTFIWQMCCPTIISIIFIFTYGGMFLIYLILTDAILSVPAKVTIFSMCTPMFKLSFGRNAASFMFFIFYLSIQHQLGKQKEDYQENQQIHISLQTTFANVFCNYITTHKIYSIRYYFLPFSYVSLVPFMVYVLWTFCSVRFMWLYTSYVLHTEIIATIYTAVTYILIFKNGRMVFICLVPTDAILSVPTESTVVCICAPVSKLLFRWGTCSFQGLYLICIYKSWNTYYGVYLQTK